MWDLASASLLASLGLILSPQVPYMFWSSCPPWRSGTCHAFSCLLGFSYANLLLWHPPQPPSAQKIHIYSWTSSVNISFCLKLLWITLAELAPSSSVPSVSLNHVCLGAYGGMWWSLFFMPVSLTKLTSSWAGTMCLIWCYVPCAYPRAWHKVCVRSMLIVLTYSELA